MQQTESMPLSETIITASVSAAVGWLASSVTKISKSEFKDAVKRLDLLEKDLAGRMTRAEFEQAFNKVDLLVREFRAETRAEFKELKNELKAKV
jgi:hypothetical protein